jgi:transposase
MQLRKTKTDKKDAVVIVQFLLANGDTLIQRATPSLISDLRDLAVKIQLTHKILLHILPP